MQAGEAQPGGPGCLCLPGWTSLTHMGFPQGLVTCFLAWRVIAMKPLPSAASPAVPTGGENLSRNATGLEGSSLFFCFSLVFLCYSGEYRNAFIDFIPLQ